MTRAAAIVVAALLATAGVAIAQQPVVPPASAEPVQLQDATLEDALTYVGRRAGFAVVVDWNSLELAGARKDSPVTVDLPAQTKTRQVLEVILRGVATTEPLDFYATGGVVRVTTRSVADRDLVTRVYDVRDLTVEVPDFTLEDLNTGGGGNNNGGNNRGGGGNNNGAASDNNNGGGFGGGQTGQERTDDLVELIRATVRPDIWRENGGPASIRQFQGQLVVTAPRTVHRLLF